jgi:sugar-specific transcriptional regulator TrmB
MKDIRTLTDLCLTILQAKKYLTLAKLGTSSIKTVAKTADIARQNVYQAIPALQRRGLVEKLLSTPSSYRATPIKEGLTILLQNRTNEHIILQNKTRKLIDKFHVANSSLSQEEAQFIITSEASFVLKKLDKQIYNAKTNIDTVSTWKFCGDMLYTIQKKLRIPWKKEYTFEFLQTK